MTNEPSSFSAAKAQLAENTATTPLVSDAATAEESPPDSVRPQVTTEPSDFRAAKAHQVENTSTTPLVNEAATAEESPPSRGRPQVMTEPLEGVAPHVETVVSMPRVVASPATQTALVN